ncbi:MAG TPA: fumarylacetoacetate hydrolase family protein [Bacilli bacterium]
MKLLTFVENGNECLGVKTEHGIVDVKAALSVIPAEKAVARSVHEVIAGGPEAVAVLREFVEKAVAEAKAGKPAKYMLDEAAITFGPCVPHPQKIICVGLNYRKHAEETGAQIPEYPVLFNKFNNTLTGHGADVVLPNVSRKVDYEAELVLVIGKKTKNVAKKDALNHVFGYCNVNDLSARDLQMRTSQWLLGKTCDGFSPLGPYLVTADEVENPNNLAIRTIVNGEVRQQSNTSDMIFPCDELVSYISRHFTLEPGDIILTGTPEGVVLGYPVDKQVYLQDGDVVTVEIAGLGSLTNRMVKEV